MPTPLPHARLPATSYACTQARATNACNSRSGGRGGGVCGGARAAGGARNAWVLGPGDQQPGRTAPPLAAQRHACSTAVPRGLCKNPLASAASLQRSWLCAPAHDEPGCTHRRPRCRRHDSCQAGAAAAAGCEGGDMQRTSHLGMLGPGSVRRSCRHRHPTSPLCRTYCLSCCYLCCCGWCSRCCCSCCSCWECRGRSNAPGRA
mmetsp:Transcript_9535/g.25732  ORF Transcript_9535/g.25732 Transcript_9535/m.25732 type:complete len:204 (-) Transcript_9535:253-864(-)